jgi:hypothetical protein
VYPPQLGRVLRDASLFAEILRSTCDSDVVSQLAAQTSALAYDPVPRLSSKIQAVGIVIAARDQCESIAKSILSIFAANGHSGWRNSLWIVVVADACTDATAKVARDAVGAFGEVLEVSARSLQTAHRIGASSVIEHFHHIPRHALLLASVDADTELCRDWMDNYSLGRVTSDTYLSTAAASLIRS